MNISEATFEFDYGAVVRFRMTAGLIDVTIPQHDGKPLLTVTIDNPRQHSRTTRRKRWPCESHARSAIEAVAGKSESISKKAKSNKKFRKHGLRIVK